MTAILNISEENKILLARAEKAENRLDEVLKSIMERIKDLLNTISEQAAEVTQLTQKVQHLEHQIEATKKSCDEKQEEVETLTQKLHRIEAAASFMGLLTGAATGAACGLVRAVSNGSSGATIIVYTIGGATIGLGSMYIYNQTTKDKE